MNSIIDETPMDVFHSSLDPDEQRAVDGLVEQHRGNAAMTQRMALDASRLLSSSQDRLQRQADAGFCKRLLGAISGSTRNNALSNQQDTLKVQKVAWHYLQQLQQQNLINAQAIAVIRNNLGTMNEFIIETRDFLGEAIDTIGNRIRPLENNARLNKWSLNIEANKRRYRSLPHSLLIVQLAYDFMLKHQDAELTLEDTNHLVVTLENLGINCDDEVRLLDFIIELIDQMDVTGIDLYRRHIQITTDEVQLESAFIQSNVSGIGFNALYYLSDQHSRIMALISDDELCSSDAAREKIISRIFGDEFDGLATTYKLRDLVSEIVGGGLLAIAIYRDLNAPETVADPLAPPAEHEEHISLVSDLPEIRLHSFMDTTSDADQRRSYIELLSLCLPDASACGRPGREFIAHLAAKAGTPAAVSGFLSSYQGDTPLGQLERLKTLLTDENRVYCWLLDAFFLLSIEGRKIESPEVMRILAILKPPQLKEQLAAIQSVLADQDAERILQSGVQLSRLTAGWSNILRYREISLKDAFEVPRGKLREASLAAIVLSSELGKITWKAMDYSCFIGASPFEEGLFSKFTNAVGSTAFSVGRKSCTSSLNQMRGKVIELLSTHSDALPSANTLVGGFGLPKFGFDNECGYLEFDLDNSAENERWSEQFEHYQRCLEKTLNGFSSACDDADRQLGLFAEGDFTTSVLERRSREREQARQQQREKNLASRSVAVEKDGHTQLLSVVWEEVQSPPCDPEQVLDLKTDGTHWLITTQDGHYYLSSDRLQWEQVHPFGEESRRASEILIIDGTWIITGYREGFAYSHDGHHWQQTPYPTVAEGDYSYSTTGDIVRLDGTWIWRFLRDCRYTYSKKGVLFDSEDTDTYRETILFATQSLDIPWSRWEATPNLPEGMEVDSLRALPGVHSLLIFCSYNWMYGHNKKRTGLEPAVKYYVPGKGWRNCTWEGQMSRHPDVFITRMADQLLCFTSNTLFRATKPYEWNVDTDGICARGAFHLEGMSLFPGSSSNTLLLSQDGRTFKDLTFEDGTWNHLCANDQGLLGLYSPNSHETWLRTGHWQLQPQD